MEAFVVSFQCSEIEMLKECCKNGVLKISASKKTPSRRGELDDGKVTAETRSNISAQKIYQLGLHVIQ